VSYEPKGATPAIVTANREAVAGTTWPTGRTSPMLTAA
jgi:hypothetical protein